VRRELGELQGDQAGPANKKPTYAVWNIPVRIEMYEKPAANDENPPSDRCSSWR
jgi:hypothetical protein